MRQKSGPEKQPAEDAIRDIRRATRRHFSAEEKIRVVLEGLRGEESIAELCAARASPHRCIMAGRKSSWRPARGDLPATGLSRELGFGRTKVEGLGSCSGRGRCPPIPQGFASEGAERVAGNKMALDVEGVLDGGVNGQEPLR